MINTAHKEDSTLFAKLLMKTTDLRTLNALHAEKTVGESYLTSCCVKINFVPGEPGLSFDP